MPTYLRGAAITLLILGLAMCAIGAAMAYRDVGFYAAAEALARHPDHVIFQGEYYAALGRHIAYVVIAVVGGLVGSVASALLFGMYGVIRRLERLEASVKAAEHAR
jgi:O-antigen/teichoic acid export membrane protein